MEFVDVLHQAGPQTAEEAQSPFLPGTNIQFAWDSTSLGYLKTCPRLYYYHMIEGWQTKGEAIHLRFGIEYHQALHDYETFKAEGMDHDRSVQQTVYMILERTFDWDPDPTTASEELKTKEHLVRTVIWYLDKFEDDPAQTYIMENGKPALEVSFRFELDYGPNEVDFTGDYKYGDIGGHRYLLCGHLDRIVTFSDEFFVMDRKTTTSTPSAYYFNQFEPNNQMTLYTLASQVIFQTPIKGVIIDAAQIAVGFSRFTRSLTYRTKDQIDEWMVDLRYWLAKAEEYAMANYWPMNDMSCDKYGGCRFRTICSKSPQVRGQFLKSNFVKQEPEDRWNPLRAR